MNNRPNCPFCPQNGKVRIIARNGYAYLIQMLDTNGQPMEGRYSINPWEHYEQLTELPNGWFASVVELIYKTPGVTEATALNVNLNLGKPAGQRLKHLHFWIIIRNEPEGSASVNLGLAALIEVVNQLQQELVELKERYEALDEVVSQLQQELAELRERHEALLNKQRS